MSSATLNIGFFRLIGMLAKGALLQYFLSLRKWSFGGLRSGFATAHRKVALLIADVICFRPFSNTNSNSVDFD